MFLTLLALLLEATQAALETYSPTPSFQFALGSGHGSPGGISDPETKSESFEFCPPVHHIPHDFPYLGPDYGRSTETVFGILSSMEQTRVFADSLRPFQDLFSRLNDPDLNSTVWAVGNYSAIPAWCQGKALHDCLANHISPHWVPTIRELSMPNTPTLLRPNTLNGDARIHISMSLSEESRAGAGMKTAVLVVNRHSRIVRHDIMARNGVIHVVGSYLPLLQPMQSFLDSLPDEGFSLLRKAVQHADFAGDLNEAKLYGATLFAPDDAAFRRLDPRYLGFLFSGNGRGTLKALLCGHLVPNRTMFSNAFYDSTPRRASDTSITEASADGSGQHVKASSKGRYQVNPRSDSNSASGCYKVPWGRRQFRLPTLRAGVELTVDITRAGGFIELLVSGGARVKAADFLCSDGIVHVVDKVLVGHFQGSEGLRQSGGEGAHGGAERE